MDEWLDREVRRRAGQRCEYCCMPAWGDPTPIEIEHIIPKQHSGDTVLENRALSCLHCNRHKGTNLVGIERRGSRPTLVPLFNPRRHKWARHFRWEGPFLVGRTPIGRVTIVVLAMNEPMRIAVRLALIEEGQFRPRRR
jgi:hypothetical protein